MKYQPIIIVLLFFLFLKLYQTANKKKGQT